MAAPHHSSLEDFDFKQKRRKVLDKKAIVTCPSTAADDVQFLEAFDLNYTFGPAAGLSRSERWERAAKLGLSPDPKVMQIVQQHPNDPVYTECMATLKRSRWEDLRKESRRLETEIDLKLVSFSKLGSTYAHKDNSTDVPVSSGHVFDTMSLEIEQLLSKLRGVNEALNEYVATASSTSPSGSLYHTLQRHNDILYDYNKEFVRTKANIVAQRQREELLGQSRRDYKITSGLNRRTEIYLKENEQIRGSEQLADEAISIAMSTKENLTHQRNMFAGVTSKVTSITTRFPLINSLVQKINLRKRRDSLILGGVIAVCIVILLIFVLR